MLPRCLGAVLALLLLCTCARADSLYGDVTPRNGAKISTSWNSKVAYSKNGKYKLDLGGRVGSYVTVYIDGKKVDRVYVDGATRVDIDGK